MKRKIVICLLTTALLSAVPPVEAQQTGKVPRIGFLSSRSPDAEKSRLVAFRQGLQELGYWEGKNVLIEQRYAAGKFDRLADLAAELIRLKVDVLVTTGAPASRAAKKATSIIPIVMGNAADPVGTGLVASLARPGGNVTGLSILTTELGVKRLELLKETFPKIRRVAVLGNPVNPVFSIQLSEVQSAGKTLGLQLQILETRDPKDFEPAFSALTEKGAGALLVLSDAVLNAHRERIASLAAKSRLPAIYEFKESVEAGGLMSYGTNIVDVYRRVGKYVDRIFKGAKPADLPVEQPLNFEFFINLKTAKQIGVTIPPNVLARADRVIK